MTTRRFALFAVVAAALAGCYRPNVQTGGLRCGAGGDGGTCPEGYHCGADRRCHVGATTMCSPDAAAVTPLCTDQTLGDQCDPICQQGCECGRCNLVGNNRQCVVSGSKARGDICNLGNDDCAPGLVCLREPCSAANPDAGAVVGRCYRYCASADHCDGVPCDITIYDNSNNDTGLRACQILPRTCDPVGAADSCGSSLLGCYVDSIGRTFCDCKGTPGAGEPCSGVYNDCAPGFRCVEQGAMRRCRQVCRMSDTPPGCPAGSVCTQAIGDPTFGFCM